MASLLKIEPKVLAATENFEGSVLHFIRSLAPDTLDFLTPNTDVSKQASYRMILSRPYPNTPRIGFQFKQFSKSQHYDLASILEQFFPGIQTVIQRDSNDNETPWLSVDRDAFLQQVLPCMFNNQTTQKQQNSSNPTIDWEPIRYKRVILRRIDKEADNSSSPAEKGISI